MVKLKIDHLPKGHRNRPGYSMNPKGLLFHTTNNWSSSAGDEQHAEYMENTTRVVSWHETVDRDSCTQHIPHSENAWHAGDGNGTYNRNWIGLEIACNSVKQGQKLDAATYKNAVERTAQICNQYNFKWGQLQPHKIVYGKNCPHNTLFSHDQFKKDVFERVAELNKKPVEKPKEPTKENTGGSKSTHKVAKGETLSEIAEKYSTTVAKLADLNNIKDVNKIKVGQVIKLPVYLHTVAKGDTLTEIAEMYNTSADYIARLNDIKDPDKIYPGQRILLHGTTTPAKPKEPVKPASNKKRIYLPATASSWRIYPVNKAPVKANALPTKLNPKKFGGLSYEILETKEPHTYVIQTKDFGKVKIYGGPETGAVIK
ncbi:LysM peptidoglycan-binding domain-containing protein [Cytobacillus horneckiae]|uniref:LysM peptidoglycan-binding domain-containing protein n=1 Tax=Cytobacillus horneckiae TaxID=549687 RepID=UPI003D9A73A5